MSNRTIKWKLELAEENLSVIARLALLGAPQKIIINKSGKKKDKETKEEEEVYVISSADYLACRSKKVP